MYELELEALPELEFEGEGEWEGEWEGEAEEEAFFGRLAQLARGAARSPALRRIGLTAARSALRGLGDVGGAVGGVLGPQGAALGRQLGARAGQHLSRQLPQREYEGEYEDEYEYEGEEEWEAEANPIARVYPNVVMAHLGHAAARAQREAEAEAFIGALVPLAARAIPRAAPAILRAAPGLVRGLASVTRTLRRSPTTRPLVRALPTVMQRTAASIARQRAQGQPVTPQRAVRTLAQQTAQVIGNPRQATQAYRRTCALDQQYHRQQRPR
jgi:hypothetical protein